VYEIHLQDQNARLPGHGHRLEGLLVGEGLDRREGLQLEGLELRLQLEGRR
jgi:hypothetical protein